MLCSVLCYAMLCYAVVCHAMPCCAMLCGRLHLVGGGRVDADVELRARAQALHLLGELRVGHLPYEEGPALWHMAWHGMLRCALVTMKEEMPRPCSRSRKALICG